MSNLSNSQAKSLVSKVTFKGKVGVLNDVGLNRILHTLEMRIQCLIPTSVFSQETDPYSEKNR